MRILISLCGEGFGHSSRILPLAISLKKRGHCVYILAYGMAYKRLKKLTNNVYKTYPEIRMYGASGKFNITKSIFKNLSNSSPLKAFLFERKFIKNKKIDLVISDSRLISTLSSFLEKKLTILITNQTTLSFAEDEKLLKLLLKEENLKYKDFLDKLKEKINMGIYSNIIFAPSFLEYYLCDKIIVPDLKKPYTICSPLLNKKREIKLKTEIVGPITMVENKKNLWSNFFKNYKNKKKIFFSLGGQVYRKDLYFKLKNILKNIGDDYLVISSSIFEEKDEFFKNCVFLKTVNNASEYIYGSDVVISSAGHSTIMECLKIKVPMILIPDDNQPEQISNAKNSQKLNFAKIIRSNDILKLKNILKKFPNKKIKDNLKKIKQKDDGCKRAVQIIEDLYYRNNQY